MNIINEAVKYVKSNYSDKNIVGIAPDCIKLRAIVSKGGRGHERNRQRAHQRQEQQRQNGSDTPVEAIAASDVSRRCGNDRADDITDPCDRQPSWR